MLGPDGDVALEVKVGQPPAYEDAEPRANYDKLEDGTEYALADFGPTRSVPLGDVVLGRSGDKGSNVNIGLFVSDPALYTWFRSYLTRDRMKQLMADEWRDGCIVERVEFPNLLAVHFVIYGFLGRGVSSTPRLDSLGKGFADWIRSRLVDVPVQFLQ